MNQHIIIIAQQIEEKIAPVTDELIAGARILQQFINADIKILMTGHQVSDAVRQLAEKSGLDIILINPGSRTIPDKIFPDKILPDEALPDERLPDEIILKNLPTSLIKDLNPAYICMAHNTKGLDISPGLAAKMNAACITGVEKITARQDGICFTRSIFNDKLCAKIIPSAKTAVLTIQPGIFKPETGDSVKSGKISIIDLPISAGAYHFLGFKSNDTDTSALDNADVIVSAGNGIREKEDLDLIFQLAELFPKSAVTGSRPICDKKWLKYSQQVGVTGATVKPKLYMACGISGSSQHAGGMRDSKFIVSINTDRHAAIFNFSDVCIIEDLTTFIPQFIQTYHDARSI